MIKLSSEPAGIIRIVFKEILAGDRRKFEAASNYDPSAGGGARDLRFSPYDKFGPVFERMFSHKDARGVCCGKFYWVENDREHSGDSFFHPPTTARPYEGRIANVDKCLPTGSLPSEDNGTAILLLVEDCNNKVWPHFTTDHSLDTEDWNDIVKRIILNCLHGKRREGTSMVGFADFEHNEYFCNGK